MSVFSLPTQRCFPKIAGLPARIRLFSAYAEVFPPEDTTFPVAVTFLCLRRGVSSVFFAIIAS